MFLRKINLGKNVGGSISQAGDPDRKGHIFSLLPEVAMPFCPNALTTSKITGSMEAATID